MKRLPKIFNALLTAAMAGLVAMLFARYYLPLAPSVAIGVVAAAGIVAIGLLAHGRGGKKAARIRREADLRRALLTMSVEKRRRFLFDAVSVHTPAKEDGDALTVTHEGEPLVLLDRLRYETLSGDEVVAARARFPEGKLAILCDAFDKNAGEAAAVLNIRLVPGGAIADLLDRLHAYPKIPVNPREQGRLKRIFRAALRPARAKSYVATAFVLTTAAFFTPYRIYYLIFSALACGLAVAAIADPFRARERST